MKRVFTVVAAGFVFALVSSTSVSSQQPAHANVPTFTKDIAPIVYKHCAQCHRPGEVAPMSLLSYEDVRPGRAIKSKVVQPARCRHGAPILNSD